MGANAGGTGEGRRAEAREDAAMCAEAGPRAIEQRYRHADQLLGKRWVGLIVRALLGQPCRFSEIGARIGLASDRTLSVRLGELEAQGIVERRVDAGARPVRIEYALTPKGRALEPVVRETARWADDWLGA